MYILYKRVTSPHADHFGPFFKGKTDTTGSVDKNTSNKEIIERSNI